MIGRDYNKNGHFDYSKKGKMSTKEKRSMNSCFDLLIVYKQYIS